MNCSDFVVLTLSFISWNVLRLCDPTEKYQPALTGDKLKEASEGTVWHVDHFKAVMDAIKDWFHIHTDKNDETEDNATFKRIF